MIIEAVNRPWNRSIPLNPTLLQLLRSYNQAYKAKDYIFEQQPAGRAYSSTSQLQVLKQAILKAGIRKTLTTHWHLRRYVTHLLESGKDLRWIQELSGHSNSCTTEIYIHVSNDNPKKTIPGAF